MKTIRYFLSPRSPWTYLGHERLLALAAKHGAEILPRPMALGERVFPVSGGLPLNQRAPQRQAYRLVELKRWSEYLGVPLNIHPRFFPVDDRPAARMIVAAMAADGAPAAGVPAAGAPAALKLAGALMRAVWAEELNIGDPATLRRIADDAGLDADALWAAQQSEETAQAFDRYTQEAIDLQVFGAPWYEYRGVPYWGQDRLEFLDRALAEK